jgi:hypothetical protein
MTTTDDFEARVRATCELLLQAVVAREMPITGDQRIRECDAAELLGYSTGALRALRDAGNAPEYYLLGVQGTGTRLSYRLDALARWIEQRLGEAPAI